MNKTIKISRRLHEQKFKYVSKPFIRLSGNWLSEAGFEYGTNITVSITKNKLIIEKSEL